MSVASLSLSLISSIACWYSSIFVVASSIFWLFSSIVVVNKSIAPTTAAVAPAANINQPTGLVVSHTAIAFTFAHIALVKSPKEAVSPAFAPVIPNALLITSPSLAESVPFATAFSISSAVTFFNELASNSFPVISPAFLNKASASAALPVWVATASSICCVVRVAEEEAASNAATTCRFWAASKPAAVIAVSACALESPCKLIVHLSNVALSNVPFVPT